VMPDSFVAAFDAVGDFSLRRLLLQLARAPADLGAVLQLAGTFYQANRALAAVSASGALARPHRTAAAAGSSHTAGAT
jgi:hypothetical protein